MADSLLATETLVSLARATTYYPRNEGRRPHRNSLYRHAVRGVKGIRLEVLKTPRGLVTSREAVLRFFERLTAAQQGQSLDVRSPNQRNRASEKAAAALAEMGI